MKHRIRRALIALLLTLCVVLSGCQKKGDGAYDFENMVLSMDVALQKGHLFFAGKVLSVGNNSNMISYYDEETTTNTVYQVQVTEDFFGCMPEEPITVCSFGTVNNFVGRSALEKDKEYIFDTTLWIYGEDVIYLLPSFYRGMPEIAEGKLYYTEYATRYAVSQDYAYYKEYLTKHSLEQQYSPEGVFAGLKETLTEVMRRDAAYFTNLDFANVDAAQLERNAVIAQALLTEIGSAEASWSGVKGVLTR